MRKYGLAGGIILVTALLCGLGYVVDARIHQASYHCVAGPNEQCASDEWYSDFQKLKTLQAPYQMPKEKQDMVAGMVQRLSRDIPAGYQWDEKKVRFVKQAMPPAPSAPPIQSPGK
jgi:hypothetical protein